MAGEDGKGRAKSEEAIVAEPTEHPIETPGSGHPQETSPFAETPATELTTEPTQVTEPTAEQPSEEPVPATDPEPTTKKLKVKADLKPKKFSIMAAALQVLQQRKVPMTCPDIIDVLATEDLWVSPGGKTPAATLYAAISRSIKDLGKASPFRKTERGRFEAKILPKE